MPEDQTLVKGKNTFKINFKIVSIVLLLIIIALIVAWRPWVRAISANTRTVAVTGTATVKATPDKFVFYPTYTSKNTNKQAALTELSKKSEELVTKLKSLGVTEENIKTNSSTVDGRYMITTIYPIPDGQDETTLQLTITTNSKESAQKVQDYLLTTGAIGSVSPTTSFSTAKQKELQTQATNEASKDAKTKAEQLAKNLGFKLGGVKTVDDSPGQGEIVPMAVNSATPVGSELGAISGDTVVGSAGSISVSGGQAIDSTKQSGFAIYYGQDELSASVNVTYFVK